MPNSLNKLFQELYLSKEHAVFIGELWANRRSLKYRSLLRQSNTKKNYLELDSENLSEQGVVIALAKSKFMIDDQSEYRCATDFLEKNRSGVLVFHQSHLMSANVLHLVSRIIRYSKRQGLDWKFILLGNEKEINPLNFDQLFIDRSYPVKSKRKPIAAKEIGESSGTKQKRALSLVLPLTCLAIAALLLLDNRPKKNTSLSLDVQNGTNISVNLPNTQLNKEADELTRSTALLEAIRQSRLRDLEFEEMLAKIDSQADDGAAEQQILANANQTNGTQKTPASAPPQSQIAQNRSIQLPAEAETAIRNNDLASVENLLTSDELRVSQNQAGESPLVIATTTRNQEIVNWLIEKNVPVNAPDQYGRTAIFYAAINGDDSLIENIIDAGGRVNVSSKLSKTPLMAAVNNNHFKTAQLLIDKGSNITAVDHSGWPAIFYAVWNTNLEMVNLLIDSGAEVNLRDNSGVSLKEIAEAKGATQIMDILN